MWSNTCKYSNGVHGYLPDCNVLIAVPSHFLYTKFSPCTSSVKNTKWKCEEKAMKQS